MRYLSSINMNTKRYIFLQAAILVILSFASFQQAVAYPLDGSEQSGIKRLLGYNEVQKSGKGALLPTGALISSEDVQLHLQNIDFEFSDKNKNAELQASIDSIFKTRDPSYSVLVLDSSDKNNIVWAGRNIEKTQNVGSVGKVLTMVGLFNALASAYPEIKMREKILRETQVHAGDWVIYDEHKVPKYNSELNINQFSILRPIDTFVLNEWLDHMVSASANGAGSVVWREAVLLKHFGKQYPTSQEEAQNYFKQTPKKLLGEQAYEVVSQPLREVGIDPKHMQQGSLWTRNGKQYIPGRESYASVKSLTTFLLRMEQGRLVDPWSSLEMKRLMYMTKQRYRYAYAPELGKSAVYFKSGSLYQCQPEEGFRCAKYMGNKRNMMNSIVTIESLPGAKPSYRYSVALISNVLKVNSAWDHSRLAAAIHQAVLTREQIAVKDEGSLEQIKKSGESD